MARYKRKPQIVEALELKHSITINTANGKEIGNPGDYLLTKHDGEQYICSQHDFVNNYELMKDGHFLKSYARKILKKLTLKTKEAYMKKK